MKKFHLVDDGMCSALIEEMCFENESLNTYHMIAITSLKDNKWEKTKKPRKLKYWTVRNLVQNIEIDESDAIAILLRAR